MAVGNSRRRRPRRRATFASVLGELIMTAGILVLGYIGWQVTLADTVMGAQQEKAGQSFARELDSGAGVGEEEIAEASLRVDEPPTESRVGARESFAVTYIPRLEQYGRVVGEGTTRAVLDSLQQGLGHYESSAMPGELGNFAVAGHRNGQGGPFTRLDEMRIGDRIYVKTSSAWYVYEFRNHEFVKPTAVGVVAPVPQLPDEQPNGRYLTLTTCNPEWSQAGRLIAYANFVGWSPIEDGTPKDLDEAMKGA